jgi:hypothetical protein
MADRNPKTDDPVRVIAAAPVAITEVRSALRRDER